MATTLTILRARIRRWLNDTEATYTYSDIEIDAWLNAGVQRIARDAPFYPKTDSIIVVAAPITLITPYKWDLAAEATDFLFFWRAYMMGSGYKQIILHPMGMGYIRDLEGRSLIVSGIPSYGAMFNTTLYLNKRPPKTEYDSLNNVIISTLIYFDYWAKPPTMTITPVVNPPSPLDDGWEDLILASSIMGAGSDIGNVIGDELVARGNRIYYGNGPGDLGEIGRFRAVVENRTHGAVQEGYLNYELGDIGTEDNSYDFPD